jgi:hypothetical protein
VQRNSRRVFTELFFSELIVILLLDKYHRPSTDGIAFFNRSAIVAQIDFFAIYSLNGLLAT